MTITEVFNEMKRNKLEIVHFNSADVISNADDKIIVLYSGNGHTIDIIFYQNSEDYVNQDGIILKSTNSYSLALDIAHMILR